MPMQEGQKGDVELIHIPSAGYFGCPPGFLG